ncbi:ABC transporter [Streptomyces hoynatensis]|uniref:ABC transporter n=1 Tax=Streptomyces hoynatensis TaxID=1141874 RepID=A0A3A9YT01_9ACTN|nr:ABC transporter [Streptomyces hoynatensis]RKN38386.1 ABC transporter [Streptomyces hoynatensis]
MAVLVRYDAALLLRSHRALAPLVLYAALLGIGVQSGQPVLDSLGFAAAALLPVAAWLTRTCLTVEPPAARDCVVAAAGPARTHLASLVTALLASLAPGTVAVCLVALISDPHGADHRTEVPRGPAAAAGLLAMVACALLGLVIGALAGRPLLRGRAASLAATVAGAVLFLVAGASPANAAVGSLVGGSQDGTTRWPLLPCAAALLVAAAAVALACRLARRR